MRKEANEDALLLTKTKKNSMSFINLGSAGYRANKEKIINSFGKKRMNKEEKLQLYNVAKNDLGHSMDWHHFVWTK